MLSPKFALRLSSKCLNEVVFGCANPLFMFPVTPHHFAVIVSRAANRAYTRHYLQIMGRRRWGCWVFAFCICAAYTITRRMFFFGVRATHFRLVLDFFLRFYVLTPFRISINNISYKSSNPAPKELRQPYTRQHISPESPEARCVYEPKSDNANTAFGIFNNRSAYTLHTTFNM